MCGRFGFFELIYFIEKLRQLELPFLEAPEFRYTASYNIAPETDIVILLGENGKHTLRQAQWGMIPHWARELPKVRPINARAESLAVKPYFRNMLHRHHCIIPASGFYEWKRVSGSKKQPYFIHRSDNTPMAFAGLWDIWRSSESNTQPVVSFTIITTEANNTMKPIHDRMPVILEPEHWKEWLEAGTPDATKLLVPSGDDKLDIYPVSTKVNSPRHTSRDCTEPVEEEGL